MQKGANVNVTVGGVTPLHIAADSGNEKMVISLLNAGADPNAVDEVTQAMQLYLMACFLQ